MIKFKLLPLSPLALLGILLTFISSYFALSYFFTEWLFLLASLVTTVMSGCAIYIAYRTTPSYWDMVDSKNLHVGLNKKDYKVKEVLSYVTVPMLMFVFGQVTYFIVFPIYPQISLALALIAASIPQLISSTITKLRNK